MPERPDHGKNFSGKDRSRCSQVIDFAGVRLFGEAQPQGDPPSPDKGNVNNRSILVDHGVPKVSSLIRHRWRITFTFDGTKVVKLSVPSSSQLKFPPPCTTGNHPLTSMGNANIRLSADCNNAGMFAPADYSPCQCPGQAWQFKEGGRFTATFSITNDRASMWPASCLGKTLRSRRTTQINKRARGPVGVGFAPFTFRMDSRLFIRMNPIVTCESYRQVPASVLPDKSEVVLKRWWTEGFRTPGLLIANEALSQLTTRPRAAIRFSKRQKLANTVPLRVTLRSAAPSPDWIGMLRP